MSEATQQPVLRTARYLRYAVGEIILVVTGILIALYINNWNTHRQQLELERQYLFALKAEFSNNLSILESTKRGNRNNLDAALEIAGHTGPGEPTMNEEAFSRLFFQALNNEVQYRPGTGIINEIISSGNLSIISNERLKRSLASLDGLMLKIRYQENEEVARERYALFGLANKEVSLRRMAADAYGESLDADRGKFLDSNLHLLQSREFDNLLNGFIVTSRFLQINYYDKLEQQLLEIIEIIDEQLDTSES